MMLKHLTIGLLLLTGIGFFSLNAQELVTNENLLPVAGNALQFTRNINDPTAKSYQQLKKAVCLLYWYSKFHNGYAWGSGFLVNSVNNSFENGEPKLYLLTVEHNDFPINTGVPDDKKREIYISFDFESADPESKNESAFGPEAYGRIRRLWRLEVERLVIDPESDIALYEIVNNDNSYPWTIQSSEIYKHTYALGWSLHPAISRNQDIVQIGHPQADLKKFLRTPLKYQFQAFKTFYSDFIELEVKASEGYFQQKGSSGSPVFDKKGRVFSIASHSTSGNTQPYLQYATLLENFWYRKDGEGLMKYLDPNSTWLSTIPGGWLEGMVLPNETDLTLEVDATPKASSVIPFSANDFFRFERVGRKRETDLADGIVLSGASNAATYLTFYPASEPDRLLYGVYLSDFEVAGTTPVFQGNSWITTDGAGPVDPSVKSTTGGFNDDSKLIRSWLLKYFRDENSIKTGLRSFQFDGQFKIQTASGTASVKAIKLPSQMPYNAVELFEPERLKNRWKHYDYHDARGKNSTTMYIDQLATYQGEEVPNLIPTDNNGGYLNLVNPNYKIGPIKTSYEGDNGNEVPSEFGLDITLHNPTKGQVAYAVWIDYFNGDVFGGKQDVDYSYNFVYDPAIHPVELLSSGTTSGNTINILEVMPTNDEILLDIGKKRTTRMRISVKKGMVPPTQGETFAEGEVEDYLIEIVAPTNGDIVAATEANANKLVHLTGKPSKDPTCSSGQEAPAKDLQGGTHSFGTTSGCADGSCYNTHNAVTNGSAINFSGSSVLAIDQCDVFIHEGFNERTVSMWIYPTSGNGKEMLYDEGGVNDGLAIRMNNGTIEAEASSSTSQNEMRINAATSLALNQWHHIMVVFDEGKLSLYQNDDPAIEMDGSAQLNSIPYHDDEAALGGTLGTNAFGENVGNYTGLTDEIIIFDDAASDVYAYAKYRSWTGNSAARMANEVQPSDAITVTGEPTFKVYPTPAKDQLNVLVEVLQPGPLKLEIVDLQGRQVYEMNRDHLSAGYHLITLSHLNLPAGPYVLLMQAGDVVRREKILIE